MSLENEIKNIITKKLEEGIIEKTIEEQLSMSINRALGDLFGTYGDVTKAIEKEIKSVMMPVIESHNYSEYVVKLDTVLTDLIKETSLENKTILKNFKNIMNNETKGQTFELSHIFELYMDYVSKNIDTYKLEIDYDDDPTFCNAGALVEVEHQSSRDWESNNYATIAFECKEDTEMNFSIKIRENKNEPGIWKVLTNVDYDLNSLRYTSEFEIFLMKLYRDNAKIDLDIEYEENEVEIEEVPEASYEQ